MIKNKRIIIFSAISLLLVLFSQSVSLLLIQNDLPLANSIVSNLIIIAALNVIIIGLYNKVILKTFSTRLVLTNLAYLGLGIIFLTAFFKFDSNVNNFNNSNFGIAQNTDALQLLIATGMIFVALVLSTLILLNLLNLILVKRKKYTERFFWAFYILLMFALVINSINKVDLFSTGIGDPDNLNQYLSVVLNIYLVFFMVTNSFRNSWINYLNKGQKIKTLFVGFIIFVLLLSMEEFPGTGYQTYLLTYSHSAGTYFSVAKTFLLIYGFLTILTLVLYLPTAGVFDKKVRQLESLYEITNAVITTTNFNKLFQMVTDKILSVLEADSAWLLIKNPESEKLELVSFSHTTKNLVQLLKSGKFSAMDDWIVESKSSKTINQLHVDDIIKLGAGIKNIGGSISGVPLIRKEGDVQGILYTWKHTDYGFDSEDKEMMSIFANQTAIAMENKTLLDQTLEKERLQHELEVAKQIQLKLLPKSIPEISDKIKIEAISIPANEVGGDYYDFIQIDKDNWGVYIGDVSGKSVSAALYMAEIKGIIQSLGKMYISPKELLINVNKILYENIDRKSFISFIAAVVNTKKNTITFSRAGHCSPALYDPKNDEWEYLTPTGIGLGLDSGKLFDKTIEEETIKFKSGSVFFMYTDGITEVFDENGEEYGEEKLLDSLKNCRDSEKNSYIDTVLEDINNFCDKNMHDDLTMVVIKNIKKNK